MLHFLVMSLGLRHLHRRKKSGNFKNILDHLIYVAAIFTPFALLPQVLQLFATKDVGSLSLTTWTILGVMNCVWLLYGTYHRESPIIITNALLAFFNFAMVVGILLYR